jgi:hypothetical protein
LKEVKKTLTRRFLCSAETAVKPLLEKKFCQNCGAQTQANQELYTKCGVRLKTQMSTTLTGDVVNTDFQFLKPYYQEEFKKIIESNEQCKGKWNWAAFWLCWLWALSKGLWLSLIIGIILSVITVGVGMLIFAILWGIRGNYIYFCKVAKNKNIPF